MSEDLKKPEQEASTVNLTVEQLKDLLEKATTKTNPRAYKEKELPRETPGNKDKSYKMQATEINLVHVELQQKQFDTETGKALFKPFVQIFEPKSDWVQFLGNRDGLKINKVLHLPTGAMTVEDWDAKQAKKDKAEKDRLPKN